MLRDRFHGDWLGGVYAEYHLITDIPDGQRDHGQELARPHDLHAAAGVTAVAPGREVHQVNLAATLVAHLPAALVEAEEERCLNSATIFGLLVRVAVAHVRLRHLQGDLVGHVQCLDEKRWGRLTVHHALVGPHLLIPRVPHRRARPVARRVRDARDVGVSQVRVVQPALIDRVEESDKVVDAEPREAVLDAIALGRRHIAHREMAHGGGGSGGAHADVGHAAMLRHPENRRRPVLVNWDVALRALVLVDVAAEDAPVLHMVEVLPQPVGRYIGRAVARRAATCEVGHDLLHVAAAAQALPAAVQLGVSLLNQRRPGDVGEELGGGAERVVVLVERQRVVDLDELPLAVLVQAQDEHAEARARELHIREDLGDQPRLHAHGLHPSD
mmetsp:Transcript_43786/g.113039  ORF Transcript_43786/g.113039 Transcript_43786/m.113039 type:complete len:386 (-) Transcript_43786:547-1704(-)